MLKFLSRLICALAFGIGIYFITHALLRIQHEAQNKGVGSAISDYFKHNPQWNGLIEYFGGTPQTLPPAYDKSIFITLIIGIVLVVVSAVIFTLTLRRKR